MIKIPPIDFQANKKQLIILASLVAVLAAFLYFTILLKPQVIRVYGAIVKAGKMKADLKGAEADIARIDTLKKEISSYKDKVERYEKFLPAEQEIPALLESLSGMARTAGVKIVGITPASIPEDRNAKDSVYLEIPILISAKSGYHELGNFLSSLEGADRFMKVADIDIRANKATPKKHDVELLVLTYVLLKEK